MKLLTIKNNKTRIFFEYLLAIIICLVTIILVLRLWKADFKVPFSYAGDGLLSGAFVKGTMDNSWFLKNKFLGAPFISNWSDFPVADNFHLLIIKIITLFFKDYGTALNIFFILTFLFTMITSLYVFRYFKISYIISLIGSLLYTFIPFHLLRGEMHLFLSAYYMIPLIVLIFVWIIEGKEIFFQSGEGVKTKVNFKSYTAIFSIIVCILVSSTGVYYAFFSCFFIFIATLISAIKKKKIFTVIEGIILISIIGLGVLANISPSIYIQHTQGINIEVAKRNPSEADYYGLKIAQLILPNASHGINIVSSWLNEYTKFPLKNEGSEYLGIFGVIGFVLLLIYIFVDLTNNKELELIKSLSKLNMAAIILGTIGGIGSLFALIISPQIRGYNRISIFIGFFAILSLGKLLHFLGKWIKKKTIKTVFYIIIILIGAISLKEQTNSIFSVNFESIKQEYTNDDKFIKTIEVSLPENSMIFQFPYVPFPENPDVNKMGDYELFKGYLHSNNLRWSYGAMKGRQADLWQRNESNKPINEFIQDISFAGFNGIYIDRYGYDEKTDKLLETDLIKLLDEKPIVSNNGRLVFFNLIKYNQELKSKYSQDELKQKISSSINPVFPTWKGGFSPIEQNEFGSWRWCSEKGELIINNTTSQNQTVTIYARLATGYDEISDLTIDSDLFSDNLKINNKEKEYKKTVNVSPGIHILHLSCNAKRVNNKQDSRDIVFRIIDFTLN